MLSFEELKHLIARVTEPGAPFYRSFYKMGRNDPPKLLGSMDEWRALPPLSKDDLIACPLAERSFVPLGKLDHLRTSSGTSGKPPLFCPRTHVRGMEYRLEYHDFKNPFLAFTVPLMPHWHERFMEEHGRPPRVISFDPKNPMASVRLAKAAGVDGFSVFLYHLQALGTCMKKESMNERIRFAEVTGEICTRAQYEYLRATFPNATILQSYNSSETEDAHIGMPCKPMDGTEPLAVYHPKATYYLELVDPGTGKIVEPAPGAEGDLLVTSFAGEPTSFPFLRFRIGDTVRVVEERCRHGSWSFTVLGRTDMDFVKVPGGILRADEVARVLRLFPERVSDRFCLKVRDETVEGRPLLSPTLEVEILGTQDLEQLARDIEAHLRTGPSFTWKEGVASGRYRPLVCLPLEGAGGKKTKRIIRE